MNIKRIECSPLDRYHLVARPVPEQRGDEELFQNVVVKKPWGFEYLLYRNDETEVWSLFIKRGFSTSLHAHPHKKTSLIVLGGKAAFSTVQERMNLGYLDGIVIGAGVFHSTEALSDVNILEIESPPKKKYDLIRLKDRYGRESRAYEDASHQFEDRVDCVRFTEQFGAVSPEIKIGDCALSICHLTGRLTFEQETCLSKYSLGAIVAGRIYHVPEKPLYLPCDLVSTKDMAGGTPPLFDRASLLLLGGSSQI